MSQKRTLDAFFTPASKRPRTEIEAHAHDEEASPQENEASSRSEHAEYPFPIADFAPPLSKELASLPARPGRAINNEPDLDLLYFQPYIPAYLAAQVFEFLRSELPFYRVEYKIKRGGFETQIRTPRWTTVFGLDETCVFDEGGNVVDATTRQRVLADRRYGRYPPRPIPKCLDDLRRSTEAATGCRFNFCLVNYYASSADSISYHSDDERFLGKDPAIASFSLGARRDFLLKHKPGPAGADVRTLKYPLASGDMILMRGRTQSNWLHSIPKRSGKNQEEGGRINITFRRAMIREGTENYYNYNVGTGPVYRWDSSGRSMELWKPPN